MRVKMKKYGNDSVKRYVLDKNRGRPNTRNKEDRDKEISITPNKNYVITGEDILHLAKQQSKSGIDKAIGSLVKLGKDLNKSQNEFENEK